MKIKKTIALLLAVATLSSFGGCAEKEVESVADTSVQEETTTFNLEERVSAAKDILDELSEEEKDLPEGTYEVNNFRFDISEKFTYVDELDEAIKFVSKNNDVSIAFHNYPLYRNVRAIAHAEGLAESIRAEGDEAECSNYENPYFECARIHTNKPAEMFDLGDISDNANLDYYFVRSERDMVCFLVSYIDEYSDAAKDYADYILASLVHVGDEVISDKGGTVENDYYTVDYSEKWYPEAVNEPDEDDIADGGELRYSIKMRYSLVDTESLMFAGLTLTAVKNSQYSTAEEYADHLYDKAQTNDIMSNAEKGTGEIFGHKAYVVSYDMKNDSSLNIHMVNNIFEDNGIQYLVSEIYPNDDDGTCVKDIEELLDNTVLS